MNAIELIKQERERQISVEGWTHEHDDTHANGELACAAFCYAFPPMFRHSERFRNRGSDEPHYWPWLMEWWKPTPNDRIRELVKAGALIVAEIERLQRAKEPA